MTIQVISNNFPDLARLDLSLDQPEEKPQETPCIGKEDLLNLPTEIKSQVVGLLEPEDQKSLVLASKEFESAFYPVILKQEIVAAKMKLREFKEFFRDLVEEVFLIIVNASYSIEKNEEVIEKLKADLIEEIIRTHEMLDQAFDKEEEITSLGKLQERASILFSALQSSKVILLASYLGALKPLLTAKTDEKSWLSPYKELCKIAYDYSTLQFDDRKVTLQLMDDRKTIFQLISQLLGQCPNYTAAFIDLSWMLYSMVGIGSYALSRIAICLDPISLIEGICRDDKIKSHLPRFDWIHQKILECYERMPEYNKDDVLMALFRAQPSEKVQQKIIDLAKQLSRLTEQIRVLECLCDFQLSEEILEKILEWIKVIEISEYKKTSLLVRSYQPQLSEKRQQEIFDWIKEIKMPKHLKVFLFLEFCWLKLSEKQQRELFDWIKDEPDYLITQFIEDLYKVQGGGEIVSERMQQKIVERVMGMGDFHQKAKAFLVLYMNSELSKEIQQQMRNSANKMPYFYETKVLSVLNVQPASPETMRQRILYILSEIEEQHLNKQRRRYSRFGQFG